MSRSNNHYDIIIVGAGPAGSSAAYYLSNNSRLNILIVDRCHFPRYKCCAGGLFMVDDWAMEFEHFKQIRDQIKRCACYHFNFYCDKRFFYSTPDTHLFDVVDRRDFDAALLNSALQRPNVNFRRAHIRKIDQEQRGGELIYSLYSQEGHFTSYWVIGAEGFGGVVNRFLGNKPPQKSDYGMCLQQDIECEKMVPLTTSVFLNWEKELGFSWIFPTVSGYSIGIGFIGKTRRALPVILNDFLKYAATQKLIPGEYRKLKLRGAPCPVSLTPRFCRDRVLLCGDSLGAVRQLTGEGIYYAIKTGKIAAETILAGEQDLEQRYRNALRPVLRQIVLYRGFPFGSVHKIILRISIRIFSLRLPGNLHDRIRRWIINKFHRMDFLPAHSSYKPL